MEFQIIDVDYTLVNERPVIRVFGKTEKGDTVCGFYEGFLPYFYALGGNIEENLKENPHVVSIKKVKRCLPLGYQKPGDISLVTLKNPMNVVEVREGLRAAGINTYEADILFNYRWMNDFGVGGMGWVKAEGGNGIQTDSVSTKAKVQIKNVKSVEKEGNVPMSCIALDIETVSDNDGVMPEASRDPVVMISVVFDSEYRGRKSMVFSTKPCEGVDAFKDEKEMLEKLVEIINDYDPDVITGFNINNFDMPYILDRMKKNDVRPVFGRCSKKYVRADKFANRYRVRISGRIIADSFLIVKRDWNLKRYGLDFVSETLLGEKKDDVKKSEIGKLWRGSAGDVKRLATYCLQDSVLALNLIKKLNLLDKYIALSKISGSLVQDMLDGGETQRIENYLLREFNKEGFVIPSKSDRVKIENGRRDALKGGFVIEPERGLHSMVLVLDFKSMYPSLIRTYNICPTTLLTDGSISDVIKTPSGASFVSKKVRHGIMPRILENMVTERNKVKKQIRNAKGADKKELDMKQLALKVMSNAFYGYFGYQRSKIHSIEIAGAITALGRNMIRETVKTIKDEYGYDVVYGDTDSVMIKVKTDSLDEAERIGKDMSEKVTEKLPGVMELEFEKIYKRFLPLTKKRYMAWSVAKDREGNWKDGLVMKGIETVRRDWCELTSETMTGIIEIILKKNDVKEAVEYFKGVITDLRAGKIDVDKLVITKSITKRPEQYEGVQPHVEVVKKMRERDALEVPGTGDRVGYVIVKGTQLLSKRAEDPAFVKEKGISIDPMYYIDNQLLPPLERIFGALGVDREELLGMGKQLGIADAINNHNNNHAKGGKAEGEVRAEPLTIGTDEVTGFMCEKCSRHYRRPPLIGACECGGGFLFSSQRGGADRAVFAG